MTSTTNTLKWFCKYLMCCYRKVCASHLLLLLFPNLPVSNCRLWLLCVTCCLIVKQGSDSSRLLHIQDPGKKIVLYLYLKITYIMSLVVLVPPSSNVYTKMNILGIYVFLLEKIYRYQGISPCLFFWSGYVWLMCVHSTIICHNSIVFVFFLLENKLLEAGCVFHVSVQWASGCDHKTYCNVNVFCRILGLVAERVSGNNWQK